MGNVPNNLVFKKLKLKQYFVEFMNKDQNENDFEMSDIPDIEQKKISK